MVSFDDLVSLKEKEESYVEHVLNSGGEFTYDLNYSFFFFEVTVLGDSLFGGY